MDHNAPQKIRLTTLNELSKERIAKIEYEAMLLKTDIKTIAVIAPQMFHEESKIVEKKPDPVTEMYAQKLTEIENTWGADEDEYYYNDYDAGAD